jgi:aspartate-semialdehyde dehydrogenase
MKIAIVGATGLVGQEMIKVINERKINYNELILVASENSKGKIINVNGQPHKVITLEEAIQLKPQIALFSAGGEVSKKWAPKFSAVGTKVIDNSSAWRMATDIKLIVPEINAHKLTKEDQIIANPNCSTTQLVVALADLHKKYVIKRMVVSTYQSVSGTGIKAINQLEQEIKGDKVEMVYPYAIAKNAIPHCDVFLDNDYTKEEMKIVNETKKIFDSDAIDITATAVRIPTDGGHSESVNVTFENVYDIDELKSILKNTKGVKLIDDPKNNEYPMPLNTKGKDDVFVGRIRRDYSCANSLNMWVVADNLRKGAATNTVQIADYLLNNNLLN